ncbi:hypothetical protein [Brevibacillus borstelensis]|uniref:hypothetical protein n=1 Tax=Brevibacillus borstelensis TaxID=45462 RepID=UPI0030BB5C7A
MSIELDELQRWKNQLEAEKEELENIAKMSKEEIERLKIRCDTLEGAVWSWRIKDEKAAESFSNQANELRGAIEQKETAFKTQFREIRSRVNEIDRLLTTIEARIAQI